MLSYLNLFRQDIINDYIIYFSTDISIYEWKKVKLTSYVKICMKYSYIECLLSMSHVTNVIKW